MSYVKACFNRHRGLPLYARALSRTAHPKCKSLGRRVQLVGPVLDMSAGLLVTTKRIVFTTP